MIEQLRERREELEAEREEIEEDLHKYKSAVEALKVRRHRQKYLNKEDSENKLQAQRLLRERQIDHQSVLRELGEVGRELRRLEFRRGDERFADAFQQAARELLTGKQYDELLQRANELKAES